MTYQVPKISDEELMMPDGLVCPHQCPSHEACCLVLTLGNEFKIIHLARSVRTQQALARTDMA